MSPVGLALGLSLGVGAWLLIAWPNSLALPQRQWKALWWLRRLLDEAGYGRLDPLTIVSLTAIASIVAGSVIALAIPIPVLAVIGAVAVAVMGLGYLHRAKEVRARTLRAAWPGVIDHIRSGVRSGLAIAPAVSAIPDTVPEDIRSALRGFRASIEAGMATDTALVELGRELADPIADRIIEVLRVAHDVGGTDLPDVLRHLQRSVRADIAVRDDAHAKQSWIRSASVLAVAAPWVVLVVIGGRGETATAYQNLEGSAILVLGAVVSVVAWVMMRSIGSLPTPQRWVA